jgi:hypothetical protein
MLGNRTFEFFNSQLSCATFLASLLLASARQAAKVMSISESRGSLVVSLPQAPPPVPAKPDGTAAEASHQGCPFPLRASASQSEMASYPVSTSPCESMFQPLGIEVGRPGVSEAVDWLFEAWLPHCACLSTSRSAWTRSSERPMQPLAHKANEEWIKGQFEGAFGAGSPDQQTCELLGQRPWLARPPERSGEGAQGRGE